MCTRKEFVDDDWQRVTRRQELAFLEYALDYFNGNKKKLLNKLKNSHPEADEDTIINLIQQSYPNMPWEELGMNPYSWEILVFEVQVYMQVNIGQCYRCNEEEKVEIVKELRYLIQLYKSKNSDKLDELVGPIEEWRDNTVNYQTGGVDVYS